MNTSQYRIKLDAPSPTVQTHGRKKTFSELSLPIKMIDDGPVRNHNKPPYCVPSMAEIAAMPWNGFNVVSTFSGCGGSCLGFKMAGFRVLWASEFVPAAQDTYRANHADAILDTRDIRTVSPQDVFDAVGLRAGEIDVVEGSPPCASFSTAGKRAAGWNQVKTYSDTKQRTDDLFFEYARLIRGLQPKVFVAENVSGLIKGVAKGYFLAILGALKACGYRVRARVLDAQWLGVPQMRRRVIFVGVREDLGLEPRFPAPLPWRYSVREVLPWIASVNCLLSGKQPGKQLGNKPSPTVTTGGTGGNGRHVVEAEADISRFAIGAEWDKLKPGEQSERYFQLVRASFDAPSPCVTQRGGDNTVASVTHPMERRKFTIAELKRICAFPDDFVLTGTYAQQWERLGRAVPPLMMRAVAECVRSILEDARASTY